MSSGFLNPTRSNKCCASVEGYSILNLVRSKQEATAIFSVLLCCIRLDAALKAYFLVCKHSQCMDTVLSTLRHSDVDSTDVDQVDLRLLPLTVTSALLLSQRRAALAQAIEACVERLREAQTVIQQYQALNATLAEELKASEARYYSTADATVDGTSLRDQKAQVAEIETQILDTIAAIIDASSTIDSSILEPTFAATAKSSNSNSHSMCIDGRFADCICSIIFNRPLHIIYHNPSETAPPLLGENEMESAYAPVQKQPCSQNVRDAKSTARNSADTKYKTSCSSDVDREQILDINDSADVYFHNTPDTPPSESTSQAKRQRTDKLDCLGPDSSSNTRFGLTNPTLYSSPGLRPDPGHILGTSSTNSNNHRTSSPSLRRFSQTQIQVPLTPTHTTPQQQPTPTGNSLVVSHSHSNSQPSNSTLSTDTSSTKSGANVNTGHGFSLTTFFSQGANNALTTSPLNYSGNRNHDTLVSETKSRPLPQPAQTLVDAGDDNNSAILLQSALSFGLPSTSAQSHPNLAATISSAATVNLPDNTTNNTMPTTPGTISKVFNTVFAAEISSATTILVTARLPDIALGSPTFARAAQMPLLCENTQVHPQGQDSLSQEHAQGQGSLSQGPTQGQGSIYQVHAHGQGSVNQVHAKRLHFPSHEGIELTGKSGPFKLPERDGTFPTISFAQINASINTVAPNMLFPHPSNSQHEQKQGSEINVSHSHDMDFENVYDQEPEYTGVSSIHRNASRDWEGEFHEDSQMPTLLESSPSSPSQGSKT